MDNVDALSHKLGSAIDGVLSKAGTSTLETLITQLEAIDEQAVGEVGSDLRLIKETRRRIAEAMFSLTIAKQSPWSLCEVFFHKCCQLGFSTDYHKTTFHIIFARRCLEVGRYNEGIRLLEPFEPQDRKKGRKDADALSKQDIKIVRELLKEMRSKAKS